MSGSGSSAPNPAGADRHQGPGQVLGSTTSNITTTTASMPSSGKFKPGSIRPCRLILAWRPARARNVDMHRCLFGLDANLPQLVAAWWQGNTLDAKAAADLWARHR